MPDYTAIANTDFDASSPVDEDFVTALRDNSQYNFNHAIRCGTFAAGARLAHDDGRTSFNGTTDGSGNLSVTVTCSFTASINFDSAPVFVCSPEEVTTGSPAGIVWTNFTDAVSEAFTHYIASGSVSTTQAQVTLEFNAGPASSQVRGRINWIAAGLVTAGE